MNSPSIDLMKKFMDKEAGLIVAYFLVNIITLVFEIVIGSVLLSQLFSMMNKNQQIGNKMIMFVILVVVVRFGYFLRSVIYDEIIPKLYHYLRNELYDKIITRYRIDYKELNVGYVLYNFEHLPKSFKNLMIGLLQEYVPNVIALIICMIYLFWKNKKIGFIILVGLILFIIVVIFSIKTSIEFSATEHKAFVTGNEHIQDRLNNLFDIYTAGTEKEEKEEFNKLDEKLKDSMVNYYKNVTGVISIMEMLTIFVVGMCFFVYYKEYKNKTMPIAGIISSILVLTYFLGYFTKITNNYIGIADVFGYSKESDKFINEINSIPIPTQTPSSEEPLANFAKMNGTNGMNGGPIEFKNIKFGYDTNKKILNGLNLKIQPGEKVAIYGKSGSGKSSLVKILLGFYGIESGTITINGMNIKNIPVDELRKNISVVNQNIKLFDKTILENMTYGVEEDISINDIEKIIGKTNIFGSNGIDGLNAEIGVSGSRLSGGQKQIINYTRAILKNAPILILDEPTSALDNNTKKIVLNMIKNLKNKTVLIITHDKEILSCVDNAYELENGKLKSKN